MGYDRRRIFGEDEYTPSDALHTKLLMHFDESLVDETGNHSPTGNSPVYSEGKFGSGIRCGNQSFTMPANEFNSVLSGNFTVELWAKLLTGAASFGAFMINANASHHAAVRFHLNAGNIGALCNFSSNSGWPVSLTVDDGTLDSFSHLALVRNGSSFMLFVNGILRGTVSYSPGTILDRNFTGNYGVSENVIDELRISDVARWTSDFEPPKYPYKIV
jgi:hypothetical protein